MIIKSLSWKRFAPHRLINYIDDNEKANEPAGYWNINIPDKKSAIEAFRQNDEFLNLRKNSNRLIHEIISYSPEDSKNLNSDILHDLTQKYLELRASKNIGFYQIHKDKNHCHVHIALSPNEYRSSKVSHFSRKEFMELRKTIEMYQVQNYPSLKHSIVYLDNNRKKETVKEPEKELVKRTGTSLKLKLSTDLKSLFRSSHSLDEFLDKILQEKPEWELYSQRGVVKGVIVNDKKYRFTTLGLTKVEMENIKKKELSEIEKRRKELEQAMNIKDITIKR